MRLREDMARPWPPRGVEISRMGDFEPAGRKGALMLTDGDIGTRVIGAASPAPRFYSISCFHPSVAAGALRDEAVYPDLVARRLDEFKANASPLSSDVLVRLDHPEGDDPGRFADQMWSIHKDFDLRVLGGCCGTDDRHMRSLALRMASTAFYTRRRSHRSIALRHSSNPGTSATRTWPSPPAPKERPGATTMPSCRRRMA